MKPNIDKIQNGISVAMEQIKTNYPRLYMAMMHHRTTDNKPLLFSDKIWLKEIYKDNSSDIVIVKASQVGMTEHFLVDVFTLAKQGKRGMYVLPSDSWRNLFVADRIDKLCDYSPYYKQAIAATAQESDSRQFKTIFGTGWKFVGSKQRNNFYEFPCSCLFIDEFDLNDLDNIVFAYDRLANVVNPYIRKYGNPSRDGRGIDREWLKSDQKEWHVTCEHCGYEQILSWERHFIREDASGAHLRNDKGEPLCERCGKIFNRLGKGRWVKMNPQSKISGYRISRLFIYKKEDDIFNLFDKYVEGLNNETAMQNFYNNYLAVTFKNNGVQITEEDMMRCAKVKKMWPDAFSAMNDFKNILCVAGVDLGKKFHIQISKVVGGIRVKVFIGTCNTWKELNELLDAFNAVTVVVDASGGGYAETREFVYGREGAWMCYYVPKDRISKPYELKYEEKVVQANRTETLDRMVADYKNRKVEIPVDYRHLNNGEYMKQLLESTRVLDKTGRPIWTKGNDHYFHADGYEKLALQISGMQNSVIDSAPRSWRVSRAIAEGN